MSSGRSHIVTLSDLLVELKENLISEINQIDSSPLPSERFVAVTKIVNDFALSFFEHLNLSVIKGEYIGEFNFIESFDNIERYFSNRVTVTPESTDDLLGLKLEEYLRASFRLFWDSLLAYKQLFTKVKKRFNSSDIQINFSAVRTLRFNETMQELLGFFEHYKYFKKYNIALAYWDHFPESDEDSLSKLIILHANLHAVENVNEIIFILKEKCAFLLEKLKTRYLLDNKSYNYTVNFKEVVFLENSFVNGGSFEQFKSLIDQHYSFELRPSSGIYLASFRSSVDKYEQGSALCFSEYHALVKHYKFKFLDQGVLNSVYSRYEKTHKSMDGINQDGWGFDQFAYRVCLNYLKNNLFSALLKKRKIQNSLLENELANISSLQNSTSIKNYFPYLRYCEHLVTNIDSRLSDFYKDDVAATNLSRDVSFLEEIYEKLVDALSWCRGKSFSGYQLPFEECFDVVKYESKSFSVFIASSFILPIDYDRIERRVSEIHSKLREFQTIARIQKSSYGSIKEIKSIKDEISKTDKRHIEILSVFAAIVIFASGSIQLASKAHTLFSAFFLICGFGFVLLWFCILLWFITRESHFSLQNVPRVHIIVLSILTVISVLFMCLSFSQLGSNDHFFHYGNIEESKDSQKGLPNKARHIKTLDKPRTQ